MKQSTIIIDSSIIAKWFLEDEEEKESALKIKEDYLQGDISIALPSITFYEVSNFLKMAVSRLRIEKHSAYNAYKRFLEFDFEVYFPMSFLKQIFMKLLLTILLRTMPRMWCLQNI